MEIGGQSCLELLQSVEAQLVYFCGLPSALRWALGVDGINWERLGATGQESGLALLLWVRRRKEKGGRGQAPGLLSLCALHVSALARPDAVNHSRDTGRQRFAGEEEREGRSFTRPLVMQHPAPSSAARLAPVKRTSHEPGGDINNPVCSVILPGGGGGGGGGEMERRHKRELSCHILQIPLGCRRAAATSATVFSPSVVGGAAQDSRRNLQSSSKGFFRTPTCVFA